MSPLHPQPVLVGSLRGMLFSSLSSVSEHFCWVYTVTSHLHLQISSPDACSFLTLHLLPVLPVALWAFACSAAWASPPSPSHCILY